MFRCDVGPARLVGATPLKQHLTILSSFDSLPRSAKKLVALALHAGLTTEEQLRVFETPEQGSRKVIVSTNIAEVGLPFLS